MAHFRLAVTLALGLSAFTAVNAQTGTALVRHAPTLNGRVEGSIRQMTAENTTFNSGARVTGDLLIPGTPTVQLNGSPTYGGTLEGTAATTPTTHKVTLNSGAVLGHVVRRSDAVALPTVAAPPQPAGTRSVSLNHSSQSPGDFATLRNLTLNSNVGQIAVPPGTYGNFNANSGSGFTLGIAGAATPAIYGFQNLTLNSNSVFQVVGPVVVILNGGFSTNANMGDPVHPEWLKLRIAGGGLSVASNKSVYVHLEAPDGTLTLNGGAQFTGQAASDRLIVNSNALLRLVAPATVNQPPTVAITQPVGTVRFVAPASFTLAAEAADADGSVARVELHQDGVKAGEDTEPPFTFPLTLTQPGRYAFAAKAADDKGAVTTSTALTIVVQTEPPGLPFAAGFEPTEGYQPGPLHGQQGWTATDKVAVFAETTGSGTQEVNLPGGGPAESLQLRLAGGTASPVFSDVLVRPVAGSLPEDAVILFTTSARVALVGAGSLATLHAAQGSAAGPVWISTGRVVPVDTSLRATAWLRLTLREDFTARKWDLYADGRMIAADLAFTDPAVASYAGFSVLGHDTQGARMDDFYAGAANPLFIDEDFDGMADAWEVAHGADPAVADRAGDLDHDGLTNIREYLLGTDPNNADTDGDGLPDGWEVQYGFDLLTPQPAATDTDGDGLADLQEFVAGTHPRHADTDGDGLPDVWEVTHGVNALVAADASTDSDGDGLSDHEEYARGTHPARADTDDDGTPDGWEVLHGFNPVVPDADDDPDRDGLTNLQEYQAGTNPQAIDTDGDGLADAVEVMLGYDPLQPQPGVTPDTDEDGDGLTLKQELLLGTDPRAVENLGGRDTDGDGLPDKWEAVYGTDPFVADAGESVNADIDNDGLTLLEEAQAGTNPNSADTDGDSLRDDYEAQHGLNPLVDDGNADPDGDSLSNREESQRGSDPQDYYNGLQHEILPLIGGDFDLGAGGLLAVRVVDKAGNALINAPVVLELQEGGAQIALTADGALVGRTAEIRTGPDGIARAYLRTP